MVFFEYRIVGVDILDFDVGVLFFKIMVGVGNGIFGVYFYN